MNLYELDALLESLRKDSLGLGNNETLIHFYEKRRVDLIAEIKERIDAGIKSEARRRQDYSLSSADVDFLMKIVVDHLDRVSRDNRITDKHRTFEAVSSVHEKLENLYEVL